MKRNIFLIVGIILGLALIGGVGYYFLNKKEPVVETKEEPEETEEEKKQKQLEEYYGYLSYVPISAYEEDYIDVETINKKYLLGLSFDKIMIDKKIGNKKTYFKNEDIDYYLNKLFNLNLSDYDLKRFSSKPFENLSSSSRLQGTYVYNNLVFNSESFNEEDKFTRYIDNYNRNTSDEIIIYEYILEKYGENWYRDLFIADDLHFTEAPLEYIKNNKDTLTEYKHIFKKNDQGYYWYSTETVDDLLLNKISKVPEEEVVDNRNTGELLEFNDELKALTLDLTPNICAPSLYSTKYKYDNYYPTIWTKFDNTIRKLISIENITTCPEDYASEDCYFDLEKIKPYYVKYFGFDAYTKDVDALKNYLYYDSTLPRYKDNKYFYMTACGEQPGRTSYYEEVDKVIKINNTIEVYVKVAFIDYEYEDTNLARELFYRDYNKNDLIYTSSYFNRDDYDEMISKVIPSIKNNLAVYKYVLPYDGTNYYFDHIERVN